MKYLLTLTLLLSALPAFGQVRIPTESTTIPVTFVMLDSNGDPVEGATITGASYRKGTDTTWTDMTTPTTGHVGDGMHYLIADEGTTISEGYVHENIDYKIEASDAETVMVRCLIEAEQVTLDDIGDEVASRELGVNVLKISGDATAADNCELMFDGTGYAGGTTKLNVGSVSSIGSGAISSTSFGTGAITYTAFGSGAIGAGTIAANTITASTIASDAITNAKIASGAIVAGTEAIGFSTHSASDVWSVTTRTITGGTITTYTGNTPQTGDAYARIGANGAGLSALPWNASWDAEVQSEVTDALNTTSVPSSPTAGTYAEAIKAMSTTVATNLDGKISEIEGGGGGVANDLLPVLFTWQLKPSGTGALTSTNTLVLTPDTIDFRAGVNCRINAILPGGVVLDEMTEPTSSSSGNVTASKTANSSHDGAMAKMLVSVADDATPGIYYLTTTLTNTAGDGPIPVYLKVRVEAAPE